MLDVFCMYSMMFGELKLDYDLGFVGSYVIPLVTHSL